MNKIIMILGAGAYATAGFNALVGHFGFPSIEIAPMVTTGAYFGTTAFFLLALAEDP